MLYGIALIDSLPFRITCEAVLMRGVGEIVISGPVIESLEETINASIQFANSLCDFGEGTFPDLSAHNLHIRLRLPASAAPIGGHSFGLLLSLELICALLKRRPSLSAFVTGGIDSDGTVLPVGDVEQKRIGATALGGTRIILPSSQLDFFSNNIIQLPVSNIFEAYAAVTYGET